jgi:hypothetical protein
MKSLSNRYNLMTTNDRVAEREALAFPLYAGRIQHTQSLNSSNEKEIHSFQGLKQQIKNVVVAGLIATLAAPLGATTAYATGYSIDHLKLYAHSRIVSYQQFQCFNQIITKESRWSYKARNGSHYGLGQMKSKHYRDLDPYRMIDASLSYITKRYKTPCNALAFHNAKGYY